MGCAPSSYTEDREPYASLADKLDTGDIVLFSGHGAESYIIRCFGISAWSHVGIVIKADPGAVDENGGLFLWHSPSGLFPAEDVLSVQRRKHEKKENPFINPDDLTPKKKSGPQLNRLHDIVNGYVGTLAIRQLVANGFDNLCTLSNNTQCGRDLRGHLDEHNVKSYETSTIDMFQAAEDCTCFGFVEEDLTSLFCSELVAATYKYFGLIPIRMSATEYQPEDFASHTEVVLNDGAKLKREIIIDK